MLGAAEPGPVAVVLGAAASEIQARVALTGALVVVAEDWEEGQAASLRAGVAALPGVSAVVVTLGDQPFITAAAIDAVVGARREGCDAVRATYAGTPGHPVLLGAALLERVSGLRGDVGARELLHGVGVCEVECGELGDPTDIDTPETLQEVQA